MRGKPKIQMPSSVLDELLFRRISREFQRRFGVPLAALDPEGYLVFGKYDRLLGEPSAEFRHVCVRLIQEAWKWGEPAIALSPSGGMACGVPIMRNRELLGGLVADGLGADSDAAGDASPAATPREAGAFLLQLATEYNLTNEAHLELRRQASDRDRLRAEAIHSIKASGYDSIREAYLREEPALLSAVKQGDRKAAREILNRLLVGIYHVGGQRLELLKSLTLELVVMIYRAAVEAGARPTELLGLNYDSFRRLAAVEDEEQLCHWLTELLERLFDGIREYRDQPNLVLIQQALRYMERNLDRNLSRDEVARVACLSPGHFSHLVTQMVGRSFRDLLLDARTARASELLRRSSSSIAAVAEACGFQSQGHFGKVFRQRTGLAPMAYRKRHRTK